VDGTAGLRLATEHLIGLGHRRIALVAWPINSRTGNDRVAGYKQALQAAEIPVEAELIAHGEWQFEAGYHAAARWLAGPPAERPTAILGVSDIMAIGAMRAGQDRGLTIGRDLSVVGFDDIPLGQYLWPPLTSVRQPIRAVGRKCVEILIRLLRGETPQDSQVLLPPELVIRQSSGPRPDK
jgi:DNA-binding LacI/PurR family transcriptional regulator